MKINQQPRSISVLMEVRLVNACTRGFSAALTMIMDVASPQLRPWLYQVLTDS